MKHEGRTHGAVRTWAIPVLVAVTAFLPYAGGVLRGEGLYFRDLTRQFFPLRLFALEGLRRGELRFWNPYVHEGEPVPLPPFSYPPDVLQLLAPTASGISASLALHVPFAALAFFALARGLGLRRAAAAGGSLVYALGGFTLSALNLYVYVQAVAWAPLVILGLMRAARGKAAIVPAALACAVAISTTGIEIVAQSLVLGLLVAAPGRSLLAWLRALGTIALGASVAAPVIALMSGLVHGSARAAGFPTSVVLAHSIHPLTFAQTVIAGLYCDTADPVNLWWGSRFFPRGFPYFLSLYLGATAVSLAAVGLRDGRPLARRLALATLIGVVVCLGRWAHLSALVETLPVLRMFRFPSKAFFMVHASIALLAALGLDALSAGAGRPWRWLSAAALGSGSALCLLLMVPALLPRACRWFASGFFPSEYALPDRMGLLSVVLRDAAKGGGIAILAGLLAVAVLWRRVSPCLAATLLTSLVAADQLRAGIGLSRSVDPAIFQPSPEVRRLAGALLREGGRVYAPEPLESPAYAEARRTRARDHELWSFAILVETATPFLNMGLKLPSALTIDTTMLVPLERVMPPERAGPDGVQEQLPLLREAGVAHVLSLDPLDVAGLRLRAVLAPPRIAPLRLFAYTLSSPLPLRRLAASVVSVAGRAEAVRLASRPGFQEAGGVAVEGPVEPVDGARGRLVWLDERPGRIEAEVESDRASALFVGDAFAPGWTAAVDGRPQPVLRANGRHCAVAVPAGRSRVLLRYAPPGLFAAASVSLASAAGLAFLWRSARRAIPR